jgi:N-acetyl-1-D-myo-inositol-2-amino-2-deoxy-alpha-D-glucopyranoside deacetylase
VPTVRRDPFDLLGLAIAVLLALVVGVFSGAVTTFTHRQWLVQAGPVPLPFGIVAGLVVLVCVVAGFRLAFGAPVAVAAAVGFLAAIGVLALPGVGGSAVVLNDTLGWSWAIAPVVVSVAVLVWPRRVSGRALRRA